MADIPQEITLVGRLMFERHLTDIAGGNISQRDGSRIYITPTGAGQQYLSRMAAVLLMPQHGIFIAAANLNKALDCLERMDTNAFCVMAQRWID